MSQGFVAKLREELAATLEAAADFAERAPVQRYEAAVADGEVAAAVSGGGGLLEVRISTAARRQIDNLTLGDHVVAAIRAAESQAADARAEMLDGLRISGIRISDVLANPQQMLARIERSRSKP